MALVPLVAGHCCQVRGLVDEPPVARTMPGEAGRIRQQWGEPLHPRRLGVGALGLAEQVAILRLCEPRLICT
jgi:hypothetical protein